MPPAALSAGLWSPERSLRRSCCLSSFRENDFNRRQAEFGELGAACLGDVIQANRRLARGRDERGAQRDLPDMSAAEIDLPCDLPERRVIQRMRILGQALAPDLFPRGGIRLWKIDYEPQPPQDGRIEVLAQIR